MKYVVVTFYDGLFRRAYPFSDLKEAHGFDCGISEGVAVSGSRRKNTFFSTILPMEESWQPDSIKYVQADYLENVPDEEQRRLAELKVSEILSLGRKIGNV